MLPVQERPPRKLVTQDSFHHVQSSRHLEPQQPLSKENQLLLGFVRIILILSVFRMQELQDQEGLHLDFKAKLMRSVKERLRGKCVKLWEWNHRSNANSRKSEIREYGTSPEESFRHEQSQTKRKVICAAVVKTIRTGQSAMPW